MKFGQLMEYNMRTIFLERSCTQRCGETSARSWFEKSKLSISLDQHYEVSYSLLLSCPSQGLSKHIHIKLFKKS